jgi:hypothetical protein
VSLDFGVWLGAFLTLGIISFLYKDNPVYKVCEAIFIGVSAGYWFVSLFWQNIWPKLVLNLRDVATGLVHGHGPGSGVIYLLAGVLGVMMLMRLLPKVGWISRWPMAFIVGATAGLYFITYLQSNALEQMKATIQAPLITADFYKHLWPPPPFNPYWNPALVFLGTFTGLVYFFFSLEHKKAVGVTARIGILFLMVTFGASFGYTVMSRMSLLIGRLDFLLGDWLHLVR